MINIEKWLAARLPWGDDSPGGMERNGPGIVSRVRDQLTRCALAEAESGSENPEHSKGTTPAPGVSARGVRLAPVSTLTGSGKE